MDVTGISEAAASPSAAAEETVVWVVDDDRSIRWVLEKALAREGIAHQSFASAFEALQALSVTRPQVLISDIRMPGESGLSLLREMRERHPQIPVIVMTAYSDLDSAVAAFQGGAFEYLPKPFDIEHALALIRRAAAEATSVPDSHGAAAPAAEILGRAPAMQEVFRAIGRLSQSSATVLITGESGTGKELVARALHRHSPRAAAPFVAINTAAIPRELLESELFGHERGAFTGAQATRRGRFEQAEGGTLFLDEIGDMPPELQVRLLRVLADGEYYRVGGHAPQRASVRIIAATHQDLEARVQRGLFREDLLHRLDVVRLRLPPLRERAGDIAPLARHFLHKSARELAVEPKTLTDDALDLLARFPFPGNVRQLENVCHWVTVMAPGQRVDVADLPPEVRAGAGAATGGDAGWQHALDRELGAALARGERGAGERLQREFESTLIRRALMHTGGHRSEAAAWLGWGRNTLTRRIQELGLAAELGSRRSDG
ncbi:MAG: nitrogen regulation protein NR(I) [Proteobacteria bacterium]|jgi:two-component system nitrogen regulation response regulator GlnG|nr:nitrogen regulation protein NR(I) [Pseudomonadota bacterium]